MKRNNQLYLMLFQLYSKRNALIKILIPIMEKIIEIIIKDIMEKIKIGYKRYYPTNINSILYLKN